MRNVAILSGLTGIIAFYAGKYVYEQEIKKQIKQAQDSKLNRNFHSPHTVQQPFRLLKYPHYNILYSTYHKSPLAVHEHLTKSLMIGDAPRSKFFFVDENIKQKHFQADQSYFRDTEAYKILKVNRGHMAAAGNYSSSQLQKFHTVLIEQFKFSFSNVIPQNYYNNGGIWNIFQRYTRRLAQNPNCESVQIISGPIYVKNTPEDNANENIEKYESKLSVLKQNGIPVPEKLYKIIKCNSKDKSYYNAFQFLNQQTYDNQRTLQEFKVQVSKIEKQTGLHFKISGGGLQQIDPVGLKIKKKQYDYSFFFGLISKSTSISEMNDSLRRAKQQKIQINFNDLTDKIRLLLKQQIASLQKQNLLECQRLLKLLRLNKKIFYLYHLEKTVDLRVPKLQQSYSKCLLKQKETAQQQKHYQQITKEMGNDFLRFINK